MSTLRYRPDIDGLRAVAVLGVVAYHAGLPVPGGFTGVDVFFVISGFLITQLLYREMDTTGGLSIAGFYARRVRRLLPALAVVVTFTLLAGFVLLPPFGEKIALAKSAIAGLAFVANEWFRINSGGYFDAPTSSLPLLHLWSLSVEEQFYVVWPLGMVAAGGIARFTHLRLRTVLLLGLGVLVVTSFGLSVWLTERNAERAFYFAGTRAWELGLGAWLALRDPVPTAIRSRAASVLGLLLIGAGYAGLHADMPFPGYAALLPALGAALLIYASAGPHLSGVSAWLASRPMVWIGLLSYSWYLWHWPLLALARSRRLGDWALVPDVLWVLTALLLAWATVRWVETPVRRGGFARGWKPLAVVGLGVASLGAVSALAFAVWQADQRLPRSERAEAAHKVVYDRSPLHRTCTRAPRQWDGMAARPECTVGKGAPVLALWGDSHADGIATLMTTAFPGQTHIELLMSACPPLLDVDPVIPGVRKMENCRAFNHAVAVYLAQAAHEGMRGVVLASRWPAYSGGPHIAHADHWTGRFDKQDLSPDDSLASLRRGLEATLGALDQAGLKGAIFLSPPEFPYPIYSCILVQPAAECGVDRPAYEALRAGVSAVIREVVSRHPNARVFDPADFVCEPDYCPAYMKGLPVSWDDDHMAASTAARIGGLLRGELAWLLEPSN